MSKHPLTDEICESLIKEFVSLDPYDMRAAADWQLAEVLKWLKGNLQGSYYLSPEGLHGYEIDTSDVIEDLKEAMRPTTTQEDK